MKKIINKLRFLLSFKVSIKTKFNTDSNDYSKFEINKTTNIRAGCKFNFKNKNSRIVFTNNNDIGINSEFNIFGTLKIGHNSFINSSAYFIVGENLSIGNNVLIGPYVKVLGANHIFSDVNLPIIQQGYKLDDIQIQDNVWIGAGVTILGNVIIEEGAIVAAGSIVTKNVPRNAIVAGSPAKLIRVRE